MFRTFVTIIASLAFGVLFPLQALSQDRVDANIITGLDVSSSVDAIAVTNQVGYMVAAIQSEAIQSRISHGRYGKIGFAVYLWSSGCASIVDWRTVSTAEDVAAVVVDLQKAQAAVDAAQGDNIATSGLTDISNAMNCGLEALQNAPYSTYRDILNIVANGTDNLGLDLTPLVLAKQRGVTINAMISPGGFEKEADVLKYMNNFVKTGATSFVMKVSTGDDMINAWIRKFIGDMS